MTPRKVFCGTFFDRPLHASERQMVILRVEPDGESVRCRWLDGTEWKEDRFQIAAPECVNAEYRRAP